MCIVIVKFVWIFVLKYIKVQGYWKHNIKVFYDHNLKFKLNKSEYLKIGETSFIIKIILCIKISFLFNFSDGLYTSWMLFFKLILRANRWAIAHVQSQYLNSYFVLSSFYRRVGSSLRLVGSSLRPGQAVSSNHLQWSAVDSFAWSESSPFILKTWNNFRAFFADTRFNNTLFVFTDINYIDFTYIYKWCKS